MKRWAILLFSILLVGCGGTSSPGASPSGSGAAVSPAGSPGPSPVASAEASSPPPSASPTAATSSGAVVLAKDSIARVVTSDLLIRSAPGTGADSEKLSPLLQDGDRIFVVAGPVAKDGYDWYQVQPVDGSPFGWVAAASRDGEPWLGKATTKCPSLPLDFTEFAPLASFQKTYLGLACFGNKPLTLTARLGKPEATCGVSPGWTIDPDWLGPCVPHDFLTVLDNDQMDPYVDAVFAPKVDLKKLPKYGISARTWLKVRVTGQFGHPAARTCRGVKEDTEPPSPPEIVLECRNVFVITSIRALP